MTTAFFFKLVHRQTTFEGEIHHDGIELPRLAHRRGRSVGRDRANAARQRALQAAAPPVGKQNAGFYRYKVGNFEVTVVTDGANSSPLADAYVAKQQKPAVNAALAADFLPQDRVHHNYTPVVVNTGSKLVAIDTGLGLGMFEQSKGAVGQYHSNLKAAGIDAAQIDTVIISHFHGDHINGLVGAGNALAFPNAEIMVPAVEHAFWTDESNASKLPEVARGQIGNVKRVLGVVGSKVTQYEAGKELVPGITAVASPAIRPATPRMSSRQATARCWCRPTSRPAPPRSSFVIRTGNSCSTRQGAGRRNSQANSTTWRRPRR